MSTIERVPTESDVVTANGESLVGVLIDTPLDHSVALCLASPLHRIFSVALEGLVTQRPKVLTLPHSLSILLFTQDVPQAVAAIQRELIALGYQAIAHIGVATNEGWRCLHGSADRTSDIEKSLETSVTAFEFETNIRSTHHQAAIRAALNQ
jgi:hypothetical protein